MSLAVLAKPLASPLPEAAPETLPCNNPAAEAKRRSSIHRRSSLGIREAHRRQTDGRRSTLYCVGGVWLMKTRVRDGRLRHLWRVRPLRLFMYGGTQ